MAVPLLDMRRIHASLLGELNAAARRVIEDGRYIMGPDVAAFEQEAAAWLEVPHAVGVSSGTDALRAVLRVLALTRGPGRVLTTPFTFVATAEAIVTEGHVPVFADVDEETCLMRVDDLERHSGPDLVGLLPVHLFGQCVPMEPLLRFAQSSGLWVVEDAAQSFGARCAGRQSGTLGLAGCFSFFPSKNLGGAGDGGLVATCDAELARLLRAARAHGSSGRKYHHEFLSGNYRLDTLQAALLRVKLPHVERWNAARRDAAARYDRLFDEAGLTGSGAVRPLAVRPDSFHVYHQYVVRVAERDGLAAYLGGHGIGTAMYYPVPLHLQEAFSGLGYRPGDLPVSERLALRTLALPIFPGITAAEQEEVVGRIGEFIGG